MLHTLLIIIQHIPFLGRLMTGPMQPRTKPYAVYGVTSAEVEIDLLTGQHIIRRVDLMIDAGLSMNPKIDVGQVEGAFVMGIGYWTSEDLVYVPDTGELITDRTWVHMLLLSNFDTFNIAKITSRLHFVARIMRMIYRFIFI